ncbi:hypothetical protein GCM10010472_10970 [Pseudonocardia halophobica]|uniref:Uncharacterized protein n=1 Tax=Pseudonocardia halophobica TaxID=29401 RepID=A0A9W6NY26_9PSEU|nr:hypothetical protein [Pseudonocardia halophobica]GLL13484.1 hypothetical protein GCM10017577_46280 [Pseudonocardia halophobica]
MTEQHIHVGGVSVAVTVTPADRTNCATPSRAGDHPAAWTVTQVSTHGPVICSWCEQHMPDRFQHLARGAA